ncbi:hypothetical protein EV426DRAFT_14428 [Tirmania nivea]|nr:hypothetical protein EV426DRAFT_14428 [Tirmania nivea]
MNSNALIFQGRTDANQLICVKFVRQYGKDVHIWCTNKGFAPGLLGFERLDGGWFMVVMYFLGESWRVLNEAGVKTESISELERKICSVITKLHESGMVHGDIREMNILVNDKNEFMLIDYDWAAIHDQVA